MRAWWAALLLALAPGAGAQTEWLPHHAARVGNVPISVQVADNEATRQQGLMGRHALPPDSGMLFVYPQAQALCFWMRDTLLALDIAFADTQGRIHTIRSMRPLDDTRHCADNAAYALEMPQGWFARHGIQAGDRIRWPLPSR